ncbi:MAG TPA: cytochrome c biogenesis CcdA family protein [Gaiellales bacterium]
MREAAVAFSAGLLSFATPCVLPLVPAYLSAIGARSTDPRRALLASLPFVLGFSLVFVALGASAGLAGGALTDHRLQLVKLSGIVIVAMGLVMVGLIRLPALDRSFAPGLGPARASGSSVLLGGAFGLAWTPCIGPVLGSILTLAATGATAARGAALLAAYAAGLAVPFMVAGVALGKVMSGARRVRDHYNIVRAVSGAVLIAAGLLVFFDKTYLVNSWVGQFTS